MAFYSKDFIELVRSSVDLVEVMRSYGEKMRDGGAGKNIIWDCPCPGRKRRNKSRINREAQLYNCYSCVNSGNVFNFIMNRENVSFPQAVETLARKAGIDLPNDLEAKRIFDLKCTAYGMAAAFYAQFRSDYFAERGISDETVWQYQCGFAPGGMKLKTYLIERGFEEDFLKDIGLVNHRGMDMFFQRIIIPITNNGRVIDLYGRRADQGNVQPHHYADGKRTAFNFDQIKDGQTVIVNEALLNAMALNQHLAKNDELISAAFKNGLQAVAIGGITKFSMTHVQMLKKKNVPLVIFNYDTDESGAGQEAAYEDAKLCTTHGIAARVMEMPIDEDVNRFFVNGQSFDEYWRRIKAALPANDYGHLLAMRKIPKTMLQAFLVGQIQ